MIYRQLHDKVLGYRILYGGAKMLKKLLMLKQLGIDGVLIDFMVSHFSKEEFSLLFEGGVFELQFKYNIFNDNEIDIFYDIDNIRRVEEFVDNLIFKSEEQGIKIISYYDEEYPANLRAIDKRPLFIYLKGNVKLLNSPKLIACVGTRKPSSYIKGFLHNIVKGLVEEGTVIVSGLAKGIDTESHEVCLQSHGKTIAVLAHGLDTVYPRENRKLAELILEKEGALISEYPIETGIRKNNFVARNRIISGLSQGVIIFEAGEKSGTMHTARFAYKQGKKIFCPDIAEETGSLSSGVQKLLTTKSAFPIKDARDVIKHLFEKQELSISINIEASLLKELEYISKNKGVSISNLISSIILDYIEGERGHE
jgi:DNA processing protein